MGHDSTNTPQYHNVKHNVISMFRFSMSRKNCFNTHAIVKQCCWSDGVCVTELMVYPLYDSYSVYTGRGYFYIYSCEPKPND